MTIINESISYNGGMGQADFFRLSADPISRIFTQTGIPRHPYYSLRH